MAFMTTFKILLYLQLTLQLKYFTSLSSIMLYATNVKGIIFCIKWNSLYVFKKCKMLSSTFIIN